MISQEEILDALHEVMDPEIPKLSIVDLGMVTDVSIENEHSVHITMTPTFAGCPAIDYLQKAVKERVLQVEGITEATVSMSFEVPWNSDKISERGREILRQSGFAPPPPLNGGYVELSVLQDVACPYCNSRNTTLENPFGPTLCRSIHYCNNCRQAFQQFKPVE